MMASPTSSTRKSLTLSKSIIVVEQLSRGKRLSLGELDGDAELPAEGRVLAGHRAVILAAQHEHMRLDAPQSIERAVHIQHLVHDGERAQHVGALGNGEH